jgi:uncharacterized protein YkwD
MRGHRRLRARSALLLIAGATLAAWFGPPAAPGVASAGAPCAHAGARPHQTSLTKLRKAMTCLVNRERAGRGLHQLSPNGRLERAAQHHTDLMLAKDCFSHKCPGEPGFGRRVERTGYTHGYKRFRFAENIGYDNTPRQMVGRWMRSSFNRHNILKRRFRDIGVGVGWGTPKRSLPDSKFETYTVVFGWRKR